MIVVEVLHSCMAFKVLESTRPGTPPFASCAVLFCRQKETFENAHHYRMSLCSLLASLPRGIFASVF